MKKPTCLFCNGKIKPKEPRIAWTKRDKRNNVTEHGSIHVQCPPGNYDECE